MGHFHDRTIDGLCDLLSNDFIESEIDVVCVTMNQHSTDFIVDTVIEKLVEDTYIIAHKLEVLWGAFEANRRTVEC